MGKVIDITDKLELNASSTILVAGNEIEVNSDAATVLKIMGVYSQKNMDSGAVLLKVYDYVFPPKAKKVIEELNMTMNDLKIVIEAAVSLIMGDGEPDEGEGQTHTTT